MHRAIGNLTRAAAQVSGRRVSSSRDASSSDGAGRTPRVQDPIGKRKAPYSGAPDRSARCRATAPHVDTCAFTLPLCMPSPQELQFCSSPTQQTSVLRPPPDECPYCREDTDLIKVSAGSDTRSVAGTRFVEPRYCEWHLRTSSHVTLPRPARCLCKPTRSKRLRSILHGLY